MASSTAMILLLALLSLLSSKPSRAFPSSSRCSDHFLRITMKRNLTSCKSLNTLGAQLGWTVRSASEIEVLFGAPLAADAGWVAWGVNPLEDPQMVGTRALIGVVQPNSSLAVGTYNITADTKLGCALRPSELDAVDVSELRMEMVEGLVTIHARVGLRAGGPRGGYDLSRLNHVWQVGYEVGEGARPMVHPTRLRNVDSTETLDLRTGKGRSVGRHRHHLRMVHGILNIVGWGTFLPSGVIIARYFRTHPIKLRVLWYPLHVTCQSLGYILGTAGWIVGLYLGNASRHYNFTTHRILAIFIFTFTTLQMLALQFRPRENDPYRSYWDMYHHSLGYALLAVIFVNIFQGIAILRPDQTWKWAYIGILCFLASIVLGLEIFTWAKFLIPRRKRIDYASSSTQKPGTDGPHGLAQVQGETPASGAASGLN